MASKKYSIIQTAGFLNTIFVKDMGHRLRHHGLMIVSAWLICLPEIDITVTVPLALIIWWESCQVVGVAELSGN